MIIIIENILYTCAVVNGRLKQSSLRAKMFYHLAASGLCVTNTISSGSHLIQLSNTCLHILQHPQFHRARMLDLHRLPLPEMC